MPRTHPRGVIVLALAAVITSVVVVTGTLLAAPVAYLNFRPPPRIVTIPTNVWTNRMGHKSRTLGIEERSFHGPDPIHGTEDRLQFNRKLRQRVPEFLYKKTFQWPQKRNFLLRQPSLHSPFRREIRVEVEAVQTAITTVRRLPEQRILLHLQLRPASCARPPDRQYFRLFRRPQQFLIALTKPPWLRSLGFSRYLESRGKRESTSPKE